MLGHLGALVPGQRLAQLFGQCGGGQERRAAHRRDRPLAASYILHEQRQSVLPCTGLYHPSGVAVDTVGAIYVNDGMVWKLAAGTGAQTVLPFTCLARACVRWQPR
jgi:hypothetical protein